MPPIRRPPKTGVVPNSRFLPYPTCELLAAHQEPSQGSVVAELATNKPTAVRLIAVKTIPVMSEETKSAPTEQSNRKVDTAESTTTEGAKPEAAKTEQGQDASSEYANTKPTPIDIEKSKEAPLEPSATVTANPEAVESKKENKPVSKPTIDLTQHASSVDPKAPKPTGMHDSKPADDAVTETTNKLATLSTDGAADYKPVETSPEFKKLAESLVPVLDEVEHEEMWGVTLVWPADVHVPTQIVLQKFLNANDNDPVKAAEQFKAALQWRKKTQPLRLLQQKFNAKKFDDLGFVTDYPPNKDGVKEVFTWNVYGSAQGRMDEVFGDLDEFMSWRIALQELGLLCLDLSSATSPISATHDPYKITQVHDYKSITFFSQPAAVKTASREVIRVFGQVYPELLKEKFFVNVPAIMGYLYAAIKLVVAAKTAKKFHPMSDGGNLAREFTGEGGLREALPSEYGGKGANGEKKAWRLFSDGNDAQGKN